MKNSTNPAPDMTMFLSTELNHEPPFLDVLMKPLL
jgi:hypothetical protein